MKTAIIVSKKDIAGMNIKKQLLDLFDFEDTKEVFEGNKIYELNFSSLFLDSSFDSDEVRLYTLDNDTVHSENLDLRINADLFVFATRHSAKAGVKTLSIHTPGNWGGNDLGGEVSKLCISSPRMLRKGFLILNELSTDNDSYEVTYEVTHHGPYINKPCFFIEIGSNEIEWRDEYAGKLIANAIVKILTDDDSSYIPKECKNAFGIGGTHYANSFNKIVLRNDICVGHICPKYALENLDEKMILQAIDRSEGENNLVLLDWKGLGKEKQRIVKILDSLNVSYERTERILK